MASKSHQNRIKTKSKAYQNISKHIKTPKKRGEMARQPVPGQTHSKTISKSQPHIHSVSNSYLKSYQNPIRTIRNTSGI